MEEMRGGHPPLSHTETLTHADRRTLAVFLQLHFSFLITESKSEHPEGKLECFAAEERSKKAVTDVDNHKNKPKHTCRK